MSKIIRSIPGRVRLKVDGMRSDASMAAWIEHHISGMRGILQVQSSMRTGRILIVYEEQSIPLDAILRVLHQVERESAVREASPSAELPNVERRKYPHYNVITHTISDEPVSSGPPLSLLMTSAAIVIISVKLLLGHPPINGGTATMAVAGTIAFFTGYPYARRGFVSFCRKSRWNTDKLLGVAALITGCLRGNLVALSGLMMLQYLGWKHAQIRDAGEQADFDPAIERYAQETSVRGTLIAGFVLVLTRNPLASLGILLACNPRPVAISSEFAWKQGEIVLRDKGVALPEKGSLSKLSRTELLLFEDTGLVFDEELPPITAVTEGDEKELWQTAWVVMQHSNHPWRSRIEEQFSFLEEIDIPSTELEIKRQGLKAAWNGYSVFAGTSLFMTQNGIDCTRYLREAGRWHKAGYDTLFIGKEQPGQAKGRLLGLLIQSKNQWKPEFHRIAQLAEQHHWKIGFMKNSLKLDPSILIRRGMDCHWLNLDPDSVAAEYRKRREAGKEWLFIATADSQHSSEIRKQPIPRLSPQQMKGFVHTAEVTWKIRSTVQRHYRMTQVWNAWAPLLVIPIGAAVPLVHMLSDTLTLLFISSIRKDSKRWLPSASKQRLSQKVPGAAAT